jgi:hypothetical protein
MFCAFIALLGGWGLFPRPPFFLFIEGNNMRVNPRLKHNQPSIKWVCPKCHKTISILSYARKWDKCSCGREYPPHIMEIPTFAKRKEVWSSEQLLQHMKNMRNNR